MIKKKFNFYLLSIITISTLLGIYLYSEFVFSKQMYLEEKTNNLLLLYKTELMANKKISEIFIDEVLRNDDVLQLIYQANQNINKKQNRQKLYNLFKEEYQRMSQKGILQFHFHLADSESFLRFHKVDKYGDKLLFRESIKKIIETKREIHGFEIGKYFDGFRYLYPLFYKNEFIGSVEASISTKEIMNQLQVSTNYDYSLIIKKQEMHNFVDKYHINKYYSEFGVDKTFYIDNKSEHSFHNKFHMNDFKLTPFDFCEKLEQNRSFAKELANTGAEKYIFVFLPINNFKNDTIGYIFAMEKDNNIFKMLIAQISKFVVAFILLLLVIKYLKKTKELEKEKENNIEYNTIGKLSAGLSHEINTPITIMKGNLEILKDDITTLPQTDQKVFMLEDVQLLENNLTRIKNIIESMREISDIHQVNIQKINLYRVIVVALRLLHYKAKHSTKIKLQEIFFDLTLDWEHEEYIIKADYKKLEQVFIVIINNAIDQLEHYGNPKNNLINIQITQTDSYIQVDIHDNGGGIDKKVLPNIFKPFESNKQHQGLSIGLSVVKKIIDEHHFSIFVKNKADGALFTIRCYTT